MPLDDIHVVLLDRGEEHLWAEEMVRKYELSVRYRDDDGPFEVATLEQVSDTSNIWRPYGVEDEYPLMVLRASFPPLSDATGWRIELSCIALAPKERGYWF